MSKRRVVLAGACRTAIGTMGGQLSSIPAPDLGAMAIKEALKRAGVKPEQVDEVYMGNVIQAGLGQNPARQAAINAGIPVEVPAITINVLCGSGLHCVNLAAKLIENGDADIVVAGGMESMSRAPYLVQQGRFGYRMGNAALEDSMIRDALTDAWVSLLRTSLRSGDLQESSSMSLLHGPSRRLPRRLRKASSRMRFSLWK